jgi:hypothetical protein
MAKEVLFPTDSFKKRPNGNLVLSNFLKLKMANGNLVDSRAARTFLAQKTRMHF